MLVLTRKPGQSVYIGDEIKITLHGIRGNQVRIGIDAPPAVKIYREEIYLQILDENKSAAADVSVDANLESFAKAWKVGKPAALDVLASTKKRRPKKDSE